MILALWCCRPDRVKVPPLRGIWAPRQHERNLILFIDADVCVQPNTLSRVIRSFEADPDQAALFGSYDDTPAKQDFLSQYRNLMHHFVHQRSRHEAQMISVF